MFRQAKPLREERILMSTGGIEHGFPGAVAEHFIQVSFANFVVRTNRISISS
jgi:hypothetical protein